ncbi:hypothetical protein HPP92_028977 [Vanilla planifolia]|uniref:Uncharacterized protein n=1 Tax=Vanilla planifolia TaxID=51239 RepID=A0A835P6J5_VANPL|nr:hypothetical protein HPP92_028977 [Vanilla planifolia]KAG0446177.1 hypothetical protein HPP92_028966 [Vanilla planifolia]
MEAGRGGRSTPSHASPSRAGLVIPRCCSVGGRRFRHLFIHALWVFGFAGPWRGRSMTLEEKTLVMPGDSFHGQCMDEARAFALYDS